jgi:hypothetical protein
MRSKQILTVLVAALVLCVSGARSQDQSNNSQTTAPPGPLPPLPSQDGGNNNSRQAPAPSGRGLFLSADSQDQDSGQPQPDSHVLSSGETMGLGSLQGLTNVIDPSLRFAESVDTGTAVGHLDSSTILGGSLIFDRHWSRYRLTASYNGGQTFYYPGSSFSQAYHSLNLSQSIQWSRLTLHLSDNFSLSPGGDFGGLYTGAVGSIGQSGEPGSIAPSLSAEQTILTGSVTSLNNTAMGEIDYSLSRRTTLTFTGTYGSIDFLSPGYVDSQSSNIRAGYNYSFDPKDSVGIVYTYTHSDFAGTPGVMQAHLAQLSLGRKVTGRLAFQISAGPELLELQNFGPSTGQSWTWSLSSSLTYQMSRATGYTLSYFHGTSAGSGVYLGSRIDTMTGGINHQLTRAWVASAHVGYARNTSLVSTPTTAGQFDNWYAGVSLNRRIGRQFSLGLNYGFQRQTNSSGECPVLSCGLPSASDHEASVALQWHPFATRRE